MLDFDVALTRGGFVLDVALEPVEPGIMAIAGPSGGGKTLLLRTLAGLEKAARGRIRFEDVTWQDSARDAWVPAHERSVAWASQNDTLFPHLSVNENLRFGAVRRARNGLEASAVIELLGLDSLLSRSIHGLSGGQRQRVNLARALVSGGRLLLLDEVLSGQDTDRRVAILRGLRQLLLDAGVPALFVSHHGEDIARLCDRYLWLENGRIVRAAPVSELGGADAGAVRPGGGMISALDCRLIERDAGYGLSRLSSPLGDLFVERLDDSAGARVRVVVRAEDVSLSRDREAATSILNRLTLTVKDVRPLSAHPAHSLVTLGNGHAMLAARLTRRSVDELGVRPGEQLIAQVKSVAVG